MFRKLFDQLPPSFFNAPNHDTFFIAWLTNYGTAGYLRNISPLHYRLHDKGLWGGLSRFTRRENSIMTMGLIRKQIHADFRKEVGRKIIKKRYRLLLMYLSSGEFLKALRHLVFIVLNFSGYH
jgi:hypothetical protein